MTRTSMASRLALFFIFVAGLLLPAHAQITTPITYCSSQNTATTSRNESIYQSDGLCMTFCQSTYAFAVLQDQGCWCSDYAPGSTSQGCDTACPGWQHDNCGGDNVYAYIALSLPPAGTAAAGSPSSASTSTPQVAPVTSSTSTSTATPTPVVSYETLPGEVRTVTYVPTVASQPAETTSSSPNVLTTDAATGGGGGGGGLNTGQAVGLTIGLVALAAIVGAAAFFFIRKRRRDSGAATEIEDFENENEKSSRTVPGSAGGGTLGPSRSLSDHSRYILGTNGREVVESWEGEEGPSGKRGRLMPVDPRLDPFASVYQNRDGPTSRESVQTIQDNHDYSRRVHQRGPILRATNPD